MEDVHCSLCTLWPWPTVPAARSARSTCGPALLAQPGLASRRCASTTRSESVLAAESLVILMAACRRGSPSLDRADGRDATAPVTGRRTAGADLVADVPLLLRSWHGPPLRPCGRFWRAPTRSLSEARRAPGTAGGWPVQAWSARETTTTCAPTTPSTPAPVASEPRASSRLPSGRLIARPTAEGTGGHGLGRGTRKHAGRGHGFSASRCPS